MEQQLNLHNLRQLKNRLAKYNCEYSKKILATIEECVVEARMVSKEKDKERRSEYQYEEVCCEICGNDYQRGYIYKHKRDKHGIVSDKPKKETIFFEKLFENYKNSLEK
jgi:hypothetical protein